MVDAAAQVVVLGAETRLGFLIDIGLAIGLPFCGEVLK
jgi:hypothetical protein